MTNQTTESATRPIATFGSDTTWAGTRITWNGGDFILEGHGPVAPQDVMYYDAQGWLVWVDPGTRAWVGAKAVAHTRALERFERASERSHRWKRILIVLIGVLLAINLVLLIVAVYVVDLI